MTDPALTRQQDPFHEGAVAAKARRTRSLAIALGLIFFVILIFAVSILRLTQNAHLAAEATGRPLPPPAVTHGS